MTAKKEQNVAKPTHVTETLEEGCRSVQKGRTPQKAAFNRGIVRMKGKKKC